MPAAFLMQQMQWREALEEGADRPALERLRADVDCVRAELLAQLSDALDVRADYAAAAALVRQLMFVEKFAAEVTQAQEARDAPTQ
jgi:molecular chaperone HscB